ncbi:MAG: CHAP domain-containing protein [Rhodospirillales bacterium]|nr:CHAP domain-containing protein [Rhodospirillales bacterium]
MRAGSRAGFVLALGAILAATSSALAPAALASDSSTTPIRRQHHLPSGHHAGGKLTAHMRHLAAGLQCVPFARAESGIALKGNAANWWDAAAGVYARGSRPEAGAVLNFRSTGHMRLGHVAVVTNVLSPREIEIDHANWTRFEATHGNVSLAMRVMDVSPDNDWTAVRVELGHTGSFGAVYPTYGFIYDRPDTGVMVANSLTTLHPTQERPALDADEVAEAPPAHGGAEALAVDAPSRSLR